MKLYEYLGKKLLYRYDVPVPRGKLIESADEAVLAAREFGEVVIKLQALTGKRGKAGGIAFASDPAAVKQAVDRIMQIRLHGTASGKLLVEEKLLIEKELYLAITFDTVSRCPVVLFSLDGGMDVEDVPEERMVRWTVDPGIGLQAYMIREICRRAGVSGELSKQLLQLLPRVYRLFRELDAELVEINPLVVTPNGLVAADAKITIDDDALYRHPQLPRITEKTALELKAEELDLAYVELDGDIAVMANGAGITMATLDMVQYFGGMAANFLDFGGGANVEHTSQALELLLGTKPKAILINIFGGITRCDVVADAFVQVKKNVGIDMPVSFRLVGTNETEGRAILEQAGIKVFRSMPDAVKHAVELARGT
ncbi:MAG TPA: ADP-forming succinate--CoA ligase subunit beta [Candidatus Limnocylindrales bacterium]|nr:ADP-forming succinate--CoA ligase subunit beta [Candidatus Limnocylindrales bacterium]